MLQLRTVAASAPCLWGSAMHALALPPCFVTAARAGEGEKKTDQPDYTEFSKLIHQIVVGQLPKVYEDESAWGQTISIQPGDKLPLPKLRTIFKKGDKLEAPHGLWRKVKAWMTDPAKDLQIQVRDLKAVSASSYRLVLDADADLRTWTEAQHWQKGLALIGFIAEADAKVNLYLECDVALSLDAKSFPPAVKVDPKVSTLKLDLKDMTLRSVTLRRAG